ncbi:porin [Caballeronia cordobensis]|uniref:porin n=1 Tax=Caballeronia cordobensis TaxID=1353886 RepID=UPI0007C874E1|nr:porin [Caballeronia cordobensis]
MSAAAFAICDGVHAQSSLTLYGSIDEGVGYVTNMKGSPGTVMGPISVPDQFGLKGVEDLGGGTSAIFRLENGYFSNTGNFATPGVLFSRLAWVGLANKRYGTLTLGRQWDLTNEVLLPNANGAVQYNYLTYHPGNIDNAAVTPINNSVKFATPDWNGLSMRAMYGFADSSGVGRHFGADVLYTTGPFKLGAVYSDTRDKTYAFNTTLGYQTFLGQDLSTGTVFRATSTRVIGAGGTWTPNQTWALHGLVSLVRLADTVRSTHATTGELGVNWNTTPFNTVLFGGSNTWLNGDAYTTVALSDLYHLSVRTMLYAEATYQHASNKARAAMPSLSPASGHSQASFRIGIQHFF